MTSGGNKRCQASKVKRSPVKREMRAYLKRRLGTFTNPLVYAFEENQGYTPTVTMSVGTGRGVSERQDTKRPTNI
jgi:hypothetical protein